MALVKMKPRRIQVLRAPTAWSANTNATTSTFADTSVASGTYMYQKKKLHVLWPGGQSGEQQMNLPGFMAVFLF